MRTTDYDAAPAESTIPPEQSPSPIRVCLHAGCTTPLARNNKIGYCRLHRGDARLGQQLCKRAGCTARLDIKNQTGYCGLHKGDAKRKPDLSEKELKERRADDRREEHHNETETVACRICGERWACLGSHGRTNHLLKAHGLTVPEYRKYCKDHGWGTPPIRSLKSQESIAKWRHDNPGKVKELGRRRKTKVKLLRATDPAFREHVHEQVRKNQQSKLSEADKAKRVRCEECPTPTWYLAFGRHLRAVHKMSITQYKALHPDAPTVAAESRQKQSEHSKGLWAERKRKLAEGEAAKAEVGRLRPKDPGRPSGPEEETRGQIRLIAAFLKCDWSLRKMSPFVFPDKPQSAYANTRAVRSTYRGEIDELRDRMTMNGAKALIQPYTPPAEKIA